MQAFPQFRDGAASKLYAPSSLHLQISWHFIKGNVVKYCRFHGLEMGEGGPSSSKGVLRSWRKYWAQPGSEPNPSFSRSAYEQSHPSPSTCENGVGRVVKQLIREAILYFQASVHLFSPTRGAGQAKCRHKLYKKERGNQT